MYTHIVFFKFKNTNEENLNNIKKILLSMEGNIKELKSLEVGIDDVRSERSFDVSIITKFDTKEDYEAYAISEYHVEKVLNVLKPLMIESKTVDYYC